MQHINVPKIALLVVALLYPALLHVFYLGNAGELPVALGVMAFLLSLSVPVLGSYIAIKDRAKVHTQHDARRFVVVNKIWPQF